MSKKVLLAIAAVVVVAMIVGLMVSVRSDDGRVTTGGTAATGASGPPGATPSRAPGATGDDAASTGTGATAPPATPVSPEIKRPEPVPPDDRASAEVRDHRGAGPTGPPSPIKSTTIALVRQTLEPQIRACADGLSIENPPLRFVAHSTLRAGGGRVTSYGMRITGAEALGPKFADCVGRAYATLSADAGDDQTDGEDAVHMPWTIP